MQVRVCVTRPGSVACVELVLPDAATVADALAAAGLAPLPPGREVGIHGVLVRPGRRLMEGDRVEVYHPLAVDPRTRRRQRAAGRSRHPK